MTEPEPTVEILLSEHERLQARDALAAQLEISLSEKVNDLSQVQEQLENMTGQRNNAMMAVSDITQERDRLRGLLLATVGEMEGFTPNYPTAQVARFAFTGTAAQIQQKMAAWESARNDQNSAYLSLVNYVRIQATV